MPWDGCELHVADLASDGGVTSIEHVAGSDGSESIWQPEWSPTGDLVFASDRSGWWNLERIRGGERAVLHAAELEFGFPAWAFGASSFAFLDDGRILCVYDRDGFATSRSSTRDRRPGGPRARGRLPCQLAVRRRGRLARRHRGRLAEAAEQRRLARCRNA
jgi:hypothetical protein